MAVIAENRANKKTSLAENSDVFYPTQKAVKAAVDAKVDKTALLSTPSATPLDTNVLSEKYVVDRFESMLKLLVQTPSGFSWKTHPLVGDIFTDGKGNFRTDYDVSENKPTGKTYYVSTTGNDSNDGLTEGTALATILAAKNKSDVVVIRVLPGVYTQSKILGASGYINKNLSIEKYGTGDVIFSTHEPLSWSLSSGMANTYEASLASTPIAVLDTRSNDSEDSQIYARLTLKTSIAEVESTAGSYWYDSATVYVHLSDDSTPDADTWALPSVGYNLYIYNGTTGISVYLEGITFYGGSHGGVGIDGASGGELYCKSLKQYFSFREGMRIKTTPLVILQDCTSAWNPNDDGFNYHATATPKINAVEIRCIGYKNGWKATLDNNNGTSIHDANKIIRFCGMYYGNKGPNVADVNTDTESWNLGCVAFASESGVANLGKVDYGFNSGNVKVWLDGCHGYSSDKTAIFGTTTDAVEAYTRGCGFEVAPEVGGSSSLVKY